MEAHTFPRTVDEIVDDYCFRRFGLQRALTEGAPRRRVAAGFAAAAAAACARLPPHWGPAPACARAGP